MKRIMILLLGVTCVATCAPVEEYQKMTSLGLAQQDL